MNVSWMSLPLPSLSWSTLAPTVQSGVPSHPRCFADLRTSLARTLLAVQHDRQKLLEIDLPVVVDIKLFYHRIPVDQHRRPCCLCICDLQLLIAQILSQLFRDAPQVLE